MRHRNRWAACAFAALAVAGCGSTQASSSAEPPAKVEAVPGAEVSKVTLTADAVTRLGIKTEPAGPTIPLSAVLYDKDGKTWTFTNPESGVYIREPVAIAKVADQVATLQSGPQAGTPVVTVGGAELLGTEYGVDGG